MAGLSIKEHRWLEEQICELSYATLQDPLVGCPWSNETFALRSTWRGRLFFYITLLFRLQQRSQRNLLLALERTKQYAEQELISLQAHLETIFNQLGRLVSSHEITQQIASSTPIVELCCEAIKKVEGWYHSFGLFLEAENGIEGSMTKINELTISAGATGVFFSEREQRILKEALRVHYLFQLENKLRTPTPIQVIKDLLEGKELESAEERAFNTFLDSIIASYQQLHQGARLTLKDLYQGLQAFLPAFFPGKVAAHQLNLFHLFGRLDTALRERGCEIFFERDSNYIKRWATEFEDGNEIPGELSEENQYAIFEKGGTLFRVSRYNPVHLFLSLAAERFLDRRCHPPLPRVLSWKDYGIAEIEKLEGRLSETRWFDEKKVAVVAQFIEGMATQEICFEDLSTKHLAFRGGELVALKVHSFVKKEAFFESLLTLIRQLCHEEAEDFGLFLAYCPILSKHATAKAFQKCIGGHLRQQPLAQRPPDAAVAAAEQLRISIAIIVAETLLQLREKFEIEEEKIDTHALSLKEFLINHVVNHNNLFYRTPNQLRPLCPTWINQQFLKPKEAVLDRVVATIPANIDFKGFKDLLLREGVVGHQVLELYQKLHLRE